MTQTNQAVFHHFHLQLEQHEKPKLEEEMGEKKPLTQPTQFEEYDEITKNCDLDMRIILEYSRRERAEMDRKRRRVNI